MITRLLALISLSLIWVASPLAAQYRLTIGDVTLAGTTPSTGHIFVDTDSPVEAITLAVTYPTTLIMVDSIAASGLAAGAEGVFVGVFVIDEGFILGVFLDSEPPFDGQTIPSGVDLEVASFSVAALDSPASVLMGIFEFVDGVYGSPPVSNQLLLSSGAAVGAAQGLEFAAGTVTLIPAELALSLSDVEIHCIAELRHSIVRLNNQAGPIEAFDLAVAHPAGELELISIDFVSTVTESVGPEQVVAQISGAGGALSVVLDALPPFAGQMIPVGSALSIARFGYRCAVSAVPGTSTHALTFVDGVLGVPPVDNSFVIGGEVKAPTSMTGATVTCTLTPPGNTTYAVGRLSADLTAVVPVTGAPGTTVDVSFFYTDPDSDIQGFQIALEFDCRLTFQSMIQLEGTILEDADFVEAFADDDPSDGDGCDYVCGVLLDAFPPFTGQTALPTAQPLRIGSVPVTIEPTVAPGTSLGVDFADVVLFGGTPIDNAVRIDSQLVPVGARQSGSVEVTSEVAFRRGDCNGDAAFDVSDAVYLLSYLFSSGAAGSCERSCDSNNSGALDIADAVYSLVGLFAAGPPPPAPHPGCGVDVTPDVLTCATYSSCP